MGIFSIVSAALKTAACAVRSAALAVMKFLKVLFALLVKLAALLWRQFCGFCDKHNFAPFKLLRSAGIVALIVILIFVISALAENSGLKSSQYGLADIGELGTQMYRYTQVRTLRDSQQLWGCYKRL